MCTTEGCLCTTVSVTTVTKKRDRIGTKNKGVFKVVLGVFKMPFIKDFRYCLGDLASVQSFIGVS